MRKLILLALFVLAAQANEWKEGYKFGKDHCFMIGDAGSGGTRLSLYCLKDGKPQAQPVFLDQKKKEAKFVCSGLSSVKNEEKPQENFAADTLKDVENVELHGLGKSALGFINKVDEDVMKKQCAAVATLLVRRCVIGFADPDPSLADKEVEIKDGKKRADYLLLSKLDSFDSPDKKKHFVQGVMYAVDKPVLATAGQRLSDNMDEDAVSKFYAAFQDAMTAAIDTECVPKTGGDELKQNNKQGDISAKTMSGTWEAYLGFWSGWETFEPLVQNKNRMIFSEAGGASLQFGFTVPPGATAEKPQGAHPYDPRRKKGGSNQKKIQPKKKPNFVEMAAETQALSTGYFEQKYPEQVRMYVMSWLGNGFNRLTMGTCYQAILDFEKTDKKAETIENPCLLKGLELGSVEKLYTGKADYKKVKGVKVCWLNAHREDPDNKGTTIIGMDTKVCGDLSNGQGQTTYQDKIVTELTKKKMVGTGDIQKCKNLLNKYMQHDDETNYPKKYQDPYTKKEVQPAGGDKFFGGQFNDLKNALRPKKLFFAKDKNKKDLYVVLANAGMGDVFNENVKDEAKSDALRGKNVCVKGRTHMLTLFKAERKLKGSFEATDKDDLFAYNIPMAQAYYWLLMESMGLMVDHIHFCPKKGLEWSDGLARLLAARTQAKDTETLQIRQYLPNVKMNERPDDILGQERPKFNGVKGPAGKEKMKQISKETTGNKKTTLKKQTQQLDKISKGIQKDKKKDKQLSSKLSKKF